MLRQLTEEKYKCCHCGELRQLVKRRGRAYLCEKCDEEMLAERRAKRRVIRELNIIAQEMLSE